MEKELDLHSPTDIQLALVSKVDGIHILHGFGLTKSYFGVRNKGRNI